MFDKKLENARAATLRIYGDIPCECAKAAVVDIVYDLSPAVAEFLDDEFTREIKAGNYLRAADAID